MKNLKTMAILGVALALGTLAFADAPVARWYDTIALSGYVQGSYVGNLNTPETTGGAKARNAGRLFDTDSNGFSFNTFLLQIAKPVSDSDHYGFTVRLRTGQDASTLGRSVIIPQEAYMTYVVPSLTKLSLIGGRFVSPEGVEGLDSVDNANFSEGLLFTWFEPSNLVGLKARYVFNDDVNATVGVVNGWETNNGPQFIGTNDMNTAKTVLWQVATTPIKQVSWDFQGLYGKEYPDPTHSQRVSLDSVFGFRPTDRLSFNVEGTWGEAMNEPGIITYQKTVARSHWDGVGLWASVMTSSIFTESVRFEIADDQHGAHLTEAGDPIGGLTAPPSGLKADQTVKEFTVTHKTMLTSNLGNRIEYRHDWSNEGFFLNHAGVGVTNQNTISTDFFVTF